MVTVLRLDHVLTTAFESIMGRNFSRGSVRNYRRRDSDVPHRHCFEDKTSGEEGEGPHLSTVFFKCMTGRLTNRQDLEAAESACHATQRVMACTQAAHILN